MPSTTEDPFEFVRVTDKDTGHRLSVQRAALPHGNFNVLKADAVDPLTGDPLPPEHNVATPAATTSGQSADTTKES